MKTIKIRYSIVALLMVVTSVFYAGRSILSISGSDFISSTQLSAVQLGYIFSSFSMSYVLFQIPCGLLLDRFNIKPLYLIFLVFWSITSISTFFIAKLNTPLTILISMIFIRLFSGLFEAPIFPSNSRIVSNWFPRHEISFASAIFSSSQYLSIAIFSPLIAIITHHLGWQFSFLYLGLIALLLGGGFYFWFHPPKKHPFINQTELILLQENTVQPSNITIVSPLNVKQRISYLLRNNNMLGVCLGQYCMSAVTFFFLTWFPIYLMETKELSLVTAGSLASIPALCGFIGNLLSGLFSDWLLRKGCSVGKSRKTPIIIGMCLTIFMLFAPLFPSEYVVVALMSVAFFGKGFSSVGWTIIADISPKSLYGLSGGVFNTFGNIAGVITPTAIAYIIHLTGNFDSALFFIVGHALLAIFFFVFMVSDLNRIQDPISFQSS